MARGIPTALLRKGIRKKTLVDRNAHVYQDRNAPDNHLTPDKPVKLAPEPKVEPAKPAPKAEPVVEPEPVVEESEPLPPPMSMDNTKSELLSAAGELGLDVDSTMKKADILAAILAATESA